MQPWSISPTAFALHFLREKGFMQDKVLTVIQARKSSTRLPSKVLMDLGGKTALEHVIHRVSRAN